MKPRNRNVMVWGCFSASGIEQLAVIDSTMNQHHIKVCLKIILGHLSKIWSWYESGSFNGSWSHSYLQIHQGMTQKGEVGGLWNGLVKAQFWISFQISAPFLQEFEKSNTCKISNIVYLKEFWKKEGSKISTMIMSKINGWYSKCKLEVVFSYLKKSLSTYYIYLWSILIIKMLV